jgi:hypothetical protein
MKKKKKKKEQLLDICKTVPSLTIFLLAVVAITDFDQFIPKLPSAFNENLDID